MVRWNRRSSAVVDMAVSWSNRNTTHQSHAILTDPILTLKKKKKFGQILTLKTLK